MTEPDELPDPYARDWGDEVVEVHSNIVVSSRDGHGDPGPNYVPNRTAPWRGLALRMAKAGWSVSVTYALAHWPDQFYKNGNLKKSAHYVHTIALRLVAGSKRAFAVWSRETDDIGMPADEWSYSVGMIVQAVKLGKNDWVKQAIAGP